MAPAKEVNEESFIHLSRSSLNEINDYAQYGKKGKISVKFNYNQDCLR